MGSSSSNFGSSFGVNNSGQNIYQRAGYNDNTGINGQLNILASEFSNNPNSNSTNLYFEPLSIASIKINGIPYDGGIGQWFINDQFSQDLINSTPLPSPNVLPQNSNSQCYAISSIAPISTININNVDQTFAQYFVLMNNFEQINNWYADRTVIEKLLDSPELIQENDTLVDFYNNTLRGFY